jgi:hypothetical protein
MRPPFILLIAVLAVTTAGCDTLFGSKQDETTEEIFEEGRTPPGFVDEVSYVPLNPFFEQGANGQPLDAPQDVYVGYDRFLYVVGEAGLHVLDRAGRPQTFVDEAAGQPLRDPHAVIQDRRLRLYVAARRDTTIGGMDWNLPVVYQFADVTTGSPRVTDIIWHPFDDNSRTPRTEENPTTALQDEAVEFTGIAVRANNRLYVSRRGPVNDEQFINPQNAILTFAPDSVGRLENTQALPLSPTRPSLRSAVHPSDVLTFVQPPQRPSYSNDEFLMAQSPAPGEQLTYAVLSIVPTETPEGRTIYEANTDFLQAALNPDGGQGFLYEENKFENPSDLGFAADGSGYIYVLDAGTDSLFTFTSNGIEGVSPPPGSDAIAPAPVSFGGTGDGATQFNDPQGVTYFDEIVYVADTGNDRIARFRLNTDFE